MGRSDCASASIGIKILLSDLIFQINETNFTLIKEMLHNGFIDDANNYCNESYSKIVGGNRMPSQFVDVKKYLVKCFIKERCLIDKYLLVPVKKILEIERFGHNRDETFSGSRPIDFDLCIGTEKYNEIEKTEIVFILEGYEL